MVQITQRQFTPVVHYICHIQKYIISEGLVTESRDAAFIKRLLGPNTQGLKLSLIKLYQSRVNTGVTGLANQGASGEKENAESHKAKNHTIYSKNKAYVETKTQLCILTGKHFLEGRRETSLLTYLTFHGERITSCFASVTVIQ